MTEKCAINPDDDKSAVFQRLVADSVKLDSKGGGIISGIIRAWAEYGDWTPLEPLYDGQPDRTEGGEQYAAFHRICEVLADDNWDLAHRLLPLVEAREKDQKEREGDEAYWKRREKRPRRKQAAASVLRLVPSPSGKDDPSEDDPGAQ